MRAPSRSQTSTTTFPNNAILRLIYSRAWRPSSHPGQESAAGVVSAAWLGRTSVSDWLGRTSVGELWRPTDDDGAHPLTELLPTLEKYHENQKSFASFQLPV
jgi:hypothetical protein